MSRRVGQNPAVRVGQRADGAKYYFFQYWQDIAGAEGRQRKTEVIGLTSQMTFSEASRKKTQFIMGLNINSDDYKIPSSKTFADAEKHYREKFAPVMLRRSTFDKAKSHLKCHLLADWKDVPLEHITLNSVNEWAWKKKGQGMSRGGMDPPLFRKMRRRAGEQRDGPDTGQILIMIGDKGVVKREQWNEPQHR